MNKELERLDMLDAYEEFEDREASRIIQTFLHENRDVSTKIKMMATYNVLFRLFRLYAIGCGREYLEQMAEEIHQGLLEEILD